jgi:hypothetical protein
MRLNHEALRQLRSEACGRRCQALRKVLGDPAKRQAQTAQDRYSLSRHQLGNAYLVDGGLMVVDRFRLQGDHRFRNNRVRLRSRYHRHNGSIAGASIIVLSSLLLCLPSAIDVVKRQEEGSAIQPIIFAMLLIAAGIISVILTTDQDPSEIAGSEIVHELGQVLTGAGT